MKKDECVLTFDVAVRTKYPDGKLKHGKFERTTEKQMLEFFVQYIEYLVKRIPNGENYSWQRKGNKLRLVPGRAAF